MKEGSDLLQAWRALSPEERAAFNQAIKERAAVGLERCCKVSPKALQRFEEKTKDYPLKGKAAFLDPHRGRLRSFVIHLYESGNDPAKDLTDLEIVRFKWGNEAFTRAQAQKLLSIAVAWLRQLELVCSVRLSTQLNGHSGKTEDSGPLDWIKPL